MSVLGLSPLGSDLGPAGGLGLITVLGVLPLTNNTCVVVFDRQPLTLDQDAFDSAINEENYILDAVNPEIIAADGTVYVPPGEVVPTRSVASALARRDTIDPIDPKQILLSSDVTLEPGVRYSVTVSPSIRGADGETFAGQNHFRFLAPDLPEVLVPVEVSQERYRDLDYVINGEPPQRNQVYRFEANGDIGIQDAAISLRKRIYRRVFTSPGGFAFAPQYGAGVAVKALARPSTIQQLANDINAQILEEPDVTDAGTQVSIDTTTQGTFVRVDSRITRTDSRVVQVLFSEPI